MNIQQDLCKQIFRIKKESKRVGRWLNSSPFPRRGRILRRREWMEEGEEWLNSRGPPSRKTVKARAAEFIDTFKRAFVRHNKHVPAIQLGHPSPDEPPLNALHLSTCFSCSPRLSHFQSFRASRVNSNPRKQRKPSDWNASASFLAPILDASICTFVSSNDFLLFLGMRLTHRGRISIYLYRTFYINENLKTVIN